MLADETIPQIRPVRAEAWLEFVQVLTGVALVAFMWMHMLLVASINVDLGGGRVLNLIARFFEASDMTQIGGPLIAAVMLVHFVVAARKLPLRVREQRAIWSHSLSFHHTDTWLWVVQAGTAFIILILGSIHMWTVLTTLPITAAKSAGRIQGRWWLGFYLVLLPMVELHVGIGVYRAGVKWGLIKRASRKASARFETKLALAMIAIGLVSLFTFLVLTKA